MFPQPSNFFNQTQNIIHTVGYNNLYSVVFSSISKSGLVNNSLNLLSLSGLITSSTTTVEVSPPSCCCLFFFFSPEDFNNLFANSLLTLGNFLVTLIRDPLSFSNFSLIIRSR